MADEPQDVFTMTQAEATAALEKLGQELQGAAPTATPSTSAEARARIEALSKNSDFREKYFSGNAEATREIAGLNEMLAKGDDRVEAVINGTAMPQLMEVTTDANPLTTRELADAVENLRSHGIQKESTLRSAINGGGVTKEEHDLAATAKHRLLGNPEWVKQYLAGSYEHRADMELLDVIILGYRPE